MAGSNRGDLVDEFLTTGGKYPGMAEHLDEQRAEDEALWDARLDRDGLEP